MYLLGLLNSNNLLEHSMTELKTTIGVRIRALRKQKGLTQDNLAEMAGIDSKSLSRIECGRFNPALDTLENLAHALEVSMREFFTDSTESIDELRHNVIDAAIHCNESELKEIINLINKLRKRNSSKRS